MVFSIVVTYNGSQWIEKCFGSLVNSTIQDHHILAIDNGSTDNTLELIRALYPEVKVIESGANLGFGKANNIGILKALEAKAEYVFLLNQDAWIEHNTIEDLIKISKINPEYGILSPIQNDARGNIEKQFSTYLSKAKLNVQKQILEVPFVNAASWLIPVTCIKKVGLFDSLFYHYGEDENYCHRAHYYKFKIGIIPNSCIVHDRGERLNKMSFLKTQVRHIIYIKCNLANINYPMSYLILQFYLKTPVFLLKKNYRRQFKIFFVRIIIIIKLPFMLKGILLARNRTKKQFNF
jgi:GT2 family glycosyltransferase